jgi:hypothetical protein
MLYFNLLISTFVIFLGLSVRPRSFLECQFPDLILAIEAKIKKRRDCRPITEQSDSIGTVRTYVGPSIKLQIGLAPPGVWGLGPPRSVAPPPRSLCARIIGHGIRVECAVLGGTCEKPEYCPA